MPGGPDRIDPADRTPRPATRRRTRILIPALIIGVILLVFAFILLVSRIGGDDGEIYQDDSGSAVVPAVGIGDAGR